jgi:hypothetical protein
MSLRKTAIADPPTFNRLQRWSREGRWRQVAHGKWLSVHWNVSPGNAGSSKDVMQPRLTVAVSTCR